MNGWKEFSDIDMFDVGWIMGLILIIIGIKGIP
jgi:hypothetical protein